MNGDDLGGVLAAIDAARARLMEQPRATVPGPTAKFLLNGTITYLHHDRRHREDGPAVVAPNGRHEWWVHGRRHRLDGPAVEGSAPRFFIDGVELTATEFEGIREAIESGAPYEWVIAFVKGEAPADRPDGKEES